MPIPPYMWLKDDGGADTKRSVDVQEREGSIETRLSPSPLPPEHLPPVPCHKPLPGITFFPCGKVIGLPSKSQNSLPTMPPPFTAGETWMRISSSRPMDPLSKALW